jgi:uncharacterized oligopeptide transporter (OPT) family protein
MPIQSLTDEQVQTWSREQKDRWWLDNVYRGSMRQLTVRSAITGFVLGGLLSATNLYIGAKTGWTLGVGLTSVILAFATFKVMASLRLAKDFTILENNAMQSVATAAGYMTGPLVSGIAAYMMVKNQVMSPWHMLMFNVVLSILGVLVAFPMKRRFINDEQQPFPEGKACGVLLDTLYTSAAAIGLFKAKALAFAAVFAGTIKFMTGESYHMLIQGRLLGMDTVRYLAEHPFDKVFGWFGAKLPAIQGIGIAKLDLNPSINLEMFGAGGLMHIRYATNMIAGMIVTWVVIMPGIINRGDTSSSRGEVFTQAAMIEAGEPVVVSTRTFDLPVTIAVGNGTVTPRGEGAKAVPISSRLTIEKDRVIDWQGRELKTPITIASGELVVEGKDPVKLTKARVGPRTPLKVDKVEIRLPATVLVFKGEELDKTPIRAEVVVGKTQMTYADGRPLDGTMTALAGRVVDANGAPIVNDLGKAWEFETAFDRGKLLNSWALWPGVAMLVCASMVSLFAKPQMFVQAFSGLFRKKKADKAVDVLAHIEFPLWVSLVGVPVVGAVGVWMAHSWFGVAWIWGALSIPLIAVLTIIAAQATALTSITPTGSLSKITQFSFGGLDKKFPQTFDAAGVAVVNPAVNLMTACMTTEVASNAANLLMDIKPGYMLGAKPRQQAVGHIIGIVAGAMASTPLFYILFLAGHPDNPFVPAKEEVAGMSVREVLLDKPDKFSFVGAEQWRGISELITGGLSKLPDSAVWAMGIAAVAGVIFEIWRMISKNKLPLSPLAFGLGIVLPPDSAIWMFLGSAFFWVMGKIYAARKDSMGNKLWIQTHEPICAGLVAGAALIGIGDILVGVFVLGK